MNDKIKEIYTLMESMSREELLDINRHLIDLVKTKNAITSINAKSKLHREMRVKVCGGRSPPFVGVIKDIMIKKARVRDDFDGRLWIVPFTMITPV